MMYHNPLPDHMILSQWWRRLGLYPTREEKAAIAELDKEWDHYRDSKCRPVRAAVGRFTQHGHFFPNDILIFGLICVLVGGFKPPFERGGGSLC